MQISFNPADLIHMMPWIVVVVFAMAVLLIDVFAKEDTDRSYVGYLSLIGLAIAFLLTVLQIGNPAVSAFSGMVSIDNFSAFFNVIFLSAGAVAVLLAIGYFKEHGLQRGEFYSLLLISVSGMMLMGSATDLLMFFVALEVMSIPIYILAAYQRHMNKSVESALKYFLMGAFSTAFLLFGIAYVYGATGSTNFDQILEFAKQNGTDSNFFILGMVFILIGFAFKIAAVPFHMWTPDVYEGAPTPVTAFMAAAVKAAAFAAFVRIFGTALLPAKIGAMGWYNIVWVLAILTMTLGNLTALVQDNIKRMLAYSSIAHAGYILIGFLTLSNAPDNNGAASVLFYLVAYAFMNFGAFAVVILFGSKDNENLEISKGWAGIGLRRPALGVAMTIFMFSLSGMPATSGFVGKFYIFKSAIDQGLVLIAIIGVLNSLISVYYYLRVLVFMYMKEADENATSGFVSLPLSLAVISSVAITMYLGLMPSSFLEFAQSAVKSLF